MDKELLKWGIEHSDPEKLKEKSSDFDPAKLDPELVDFILGRRAPDGVKQVTLKECVENIREREVLEERLAAFDHLQMLVEDIDHAISMENLGLWTGVIECLEDAEEEIQVYALWTLATAAHHNPQVQQAFTKYELLPRALTILTDDSVSLAVRQKAMSFISAFVKQHMAGFIEFTQLGGFGTLGTLFQSESSDERLKDRITFFLDHLFEERPRLQREHPDLYTRVQTHRQAVNAKQEQAE